MGGTEAGGAVLAFLYFSLKINISIKQFRSY